MTTHTLSSLTEQLAGSPKMGDIKKLGKEIKKDHALANALWESGVYPLRLLATLIFDKKELDADTLEALANSLEPHSEDERNQLGDWLLANQLTKDKKLVALMESWQHHSLPTLRRWFWYHQARLRWMGRTPPPPNSAELLDAVEKDLAHETPDVQWAMNYCTGQIGIFEADLRARCVAIGETVGLYKGDKVAKNCTPSYLPEFIRIEVEKRAG